MRRDGRQVYLCANSGGLSKAQMAVRTAECLGKERSRISTIQHAWTGQGTGRMETRLRGAEPTQNVENDACVSPEGDNIALISPPGKPLLRAMAGQTAIGVDARTMWRQYRQLKFCLPRGFLALCLMRSSLDAMHRSNVVRISCGIFFEILASLTSAWQPASAQAWRAEMHNLLGSGATHQVSTTPDHEMYSCINAHPPCAHCVSLVASDADNSLEPRHIRRSQLQINQRDFCPR
ncbi:hypothetical protein AWB78_05882 [Caballeronia calidae]|uniref:Uncharacterized protein n=1 Tax=Caballeronia calidae TaxID=1777139 RepID=A0A158DZR6_9BURK|nr:hypothetical protein AWB78_05882 [Caballeronia calidae]